MGKEIIAAAIGFFAGLYLFYTGFKALHFKRLVENMPTSKVRSVAVGLVELKGEGIQMSKDDIFEAPFTKKDCIYYKILVEEYKQEGKNSKWVIIKTEEKKPPFYLMDDTGKVMVDPAKATIDIPDDYKEETGIMKAPSTNVARYLQQNGIASKGFIFNKKMRYTEWHIAPKDQLYILGDACMLDRKSSKNCENIIIRKDDNDEPFYISDKSEKDIIKSWQWKILLGIYGGAALSIACLVIILYSIGVF